jgi:hypothetical protein
VREQDAGSVKETQKKKSAERQRVGQTWAGLMGDARE